MFSIIIPTMKKNIKVLTMLLDELTSDENINEIIIIDNSLKGIQYQSTKIKVITPNTNIFVNPAWNLGVELAQNEYIGILNDDLIFPQNFFSDIYQYITKNNNIGYIGLDTIPKTKINDFIDYPKYTKLKLNKIETRPLCWGAAFFFKKSNYFKIPQELKIWCGDDYLFDESLKNGLENYAISNSNIMHLHSLTSDLKDFDKIKYQDQKNYKKINEKYNLMKPVNNTSILENIFSVKPDSNKKHLIITILGLKLKIRRNKKNNQID